MSWDTYQAAFENTESFRDIYILDTTLGEWEGLITLLHQSPYYVMLFFKQNNWLMEAEYPPSVEDLFSDVGASPYLLQIKVGNLELVSYFFSESEIEFEFAAGMITDENELNQLFTFMQMLGDHFGRDILLTASGREEAVYFRYAIQSQTVICEFCP